MPTIKQRMKNMWSLGAMSPEQQTAYWKEYRTSIGIDAGVGGAKTFDNYLASKRSGLDGFDKIKDSDGKPITDKLKNDPALIAQMANVFVVTPETATAQAEFNATLKHMNEKIKKDPPEFNPGAFVFVLQEQKATAMQAIKGQQEEEITRLTTKFKEPNFREKIQDTMGLTTDGEVDKVRDEIIADLQKAHAEDTQKFEKELTDSITALHKTIEDEYARISLLGDRYWRNKEIRKAIGALAKSKQPQENASVEINADGDPPYALLKNINVSDLPLIYTLTGRRLDRVDPKTYSMQLSREWCFLDRGFRHANKSVEKDLASLAHTIRACGHQVITMDVNATDPEKAKELGKKAFEACIEAGFDPKNVHIKVNGKLVSDQYDAQGKVKTPGELFADEPTRRQVANNRAGQIEKERQGRAFTNPNVEIEATKLKKELITMRTQQPEEAEGANMSPPTAPVA